MVGWLKVPRALNTMLKRVKVPRVGTLGSKGMLLQGGKSALRKKMRAFDNCSLQMKTQAVTQKVALAGSSTSVAKSFNCVYNKHMTRGLLSVSFLI